MSELKDAVQRWVEHCQYVQTITVVNTAQYKEQANEIIKKCKKDFQFFVQEVFPHYAIDKTTGQIIANADFHNEWAYQVLKHKNFFGVAEWPREHAKSVMNTIIIPLWLLINGELDGMILTSKSETAAVRLLSDIQAELQYNQRFIALFGEQYNEGSWEVGQFATKQNIFFVALGRGQSPRGIRSGAKRPNLGVADDIDDDQIVNNQSRVQAVVEWLLGAFYGALDIRQSRFIMVGNRFHPKQILAHIVGDVEEGDPKRENLIHSKVYATTNGELDGQPTWWQKYTKAVLQFRFGVIGSIMALREYFHKYVIKGKRFKAEWIHWDKVPPLKELDCAVVYFDPSYKATSDNDYKAVRFWGRKGIKRYLIDAYVRQTTITQAVKWMYDLYESIPADERALVEFWMEDVFLQDQFFQDFEEEATERGYYLPVRGDKRQKPEKFARIEAMTPMYERGHVIWNEAKRKSPDMQTGYLQYMGFEKGSAIHDDAPDADEGANEKMNKKVFKQKFPPKIGTDKNANAW